MRVLVVADMKALADVVVKGLREAAMAVDVAYDKGEAACKLDINEYEVVIVDRALQGHDGDAVCRLVAESEHPTMILMLTAADAPEDTIAGLDLGADDCLAKPFHLRELVLRVRALAAATAGSTKPRAPYGQRRARPAAAHGSAWGPTTGALGKGVRSARDAPAMRRRGAQRRTPPRTRLGRTR